MKTRLVTRTMSSDYTPEPSAKKVAKKRYGELRGRKLTAASKGSKIAIEGKAFGDYPAKGFGVGGHERRGVQYMLGVAGRPGGGYLKMAEMVERGLPVGAVDRLARVVAPHDTGFSGKIVPPGTLARRRQATDGVLSSEESARAVRTARIFERAVEVWKNEQDARDFLSRPHMLLENRSPLDVTIKTDEGARVVEEILGKLQYGSAA